MISICLCIGYSLFGSSSLSTKGKRRFYICVSVQRKIAVWVAKKPDIFGLFAGDIFFVSTLWYARLDSNQRPLESELSGCQAANRCGTMVWWVLHKFAAFYEKTSEALRHKASEVFRSTSQIVVWIKCGFSSPVQLNIFTLYPWIRSAASHPSTLARSSTIPACAFASSYCFCS